MESPKEFLHLSFQTTQNFRAFLKTSLDIRQGQITFFPVAESVRVGHGTDSLSQLLLQLILLLKILEATLLILKCFQLQVQRLWMLYKILHFPQNEFKL